MNMTKLLGVLTLSTVLSGCWGAESAPQSEDLGLAACDAAFEAFVSLAELEHGEIKVEEKEIKDDRVRILASGPNARGETVYNDIFCKFSKTRLPTEREATLKLSTIETDFENFSLMGFDRLLTEGGFKPLTETLEERKLNAISPNDTEVEVEG